MTNGDPVSRSEPALDPWARQDGEGETAWAYFQAYRDMDCPRSLERLATGLEVSYGTIRNVSSEWRWADRVAAWDRARDLAANEVTLEEVARRRRSDLRALGDAIDLHADRVRRAVRDSTGDQEHGDYVSIAAASRAMVELVKAEMLLLGEATARVEGPDGGVVGLDALDLDALSEEELWQLRALLSKARRD